MICDCSYFNPVIFFFALNGCWNFFLNPSPTLDLSSHRNNPTPTPHTCPLKDLQDLFLLRSEGEMETTCLCCMIIIIFISQKENGKPFNKQVQRNIRHAPPPPPTHTNRPLEREYKHISNMNSHGYILTNQKHKIYIQTQAFIYKSSLSKKNA